MCGEPATSKEHIPPKCLFPEQKDLFARMNLRKQLLKVPSCDLHNLNKSTDDEYLLYLLVINLPSNRVAQNQYFTKIKRAITRNPSLLDRFTNNATPVVIEDTQSGKASKSFAFKVDEERLNHIVDHMARALYFNYFKKKWLWSIKYQAEFLLATLDPTLSEERNAPILEITQKADKRFAEAEYLGGNPEVFKYQVREDYESFSCAMRLHFYEGCRLLLMFEKDEQHGVSF
jgi:hypothetical protein